jgi:hypothetical protein
MHFLHEIYKNKIFMLAISTPHPTFANAKATFSRKREKEGSETKDNTRL